MNINSTSKTQKLLINLSKYISLIALLYLFNVAALYAQPINDNCGGAINLSIANDEQTISWTTGTTIGTGDAALQTAPIACSANFYRDDVWYKLSIPSNAEDKILNISVDVNIPGHMTGVGIAIYSNNSCLASNDPLYCNNTSTQSDHPYNHRISMQCFNPGQEILLRIWSAEGPLTNWQLGEGSFKIAAFLDNNNGNKILWGANGEGTFNGGLNGWTTTSNSCNNYPLWFWSKDTMCTKGAYFAGGGKINSLSGCNGAACFDSDFYDNGGDQGTAGAGPCPAPQSGTLESPAIDLSTYTLGGGVNLVFCQAMRQYLSKFFIEYSYDNGNNWISKEINTIEEDNVVYQQNAEHVNNTRRIFIPNAGGHSQFKIRFRFEANYYYWIIDDVYITERENYNLKLNNSIAIAPNKIWQRDQLYSFGGLASIENVGGKTAKKTHLKLEISDPDNSLVWIDNKLIGDISPDTLVDIFQDQEFTHPNKNVGTYTGKYTVDQDSIDFDSSDNIKSFDWNVSPYRMAKENIGAGGIGLRPSTDINFTWGNIFHIVTPEASNGKENYKCHEVEVGIANPNELTDATIFTWVYKWVDLNQDGIVEEVERITVGYTQYDFSPGEIPNTLYTLPIYDFNTFEEGIDLEANTDYIVAVQYSAPAINPNLACLILADPTITYDYTSYRKLIKNPGQVAYNHILDVGNTGTFSTSTFANGEVPVVRMLLTNGDSLSGYTSTVKGNIYIDLDCNGTINNTEPVLSQKVLYNFQTNAPIAFTSPLGSYLIHLKELETLSYFTKPIPGFTVQPDNYVIVNDTLGKHYTGFDFRFCPDSVFHNVKIELTALNAPRPGFKHKYLICYENIGTQTEDVTVVFNFSGGQGDNFTTVTNAAGGIVNGHTITWNISNLALFEEQCKEIELLIFSGTNSGTLLGPHVSISLAAGLTDVNTFDNDYRLNETVVASFDPNDKTVNREGFTSIELEKGVSLDYLIRFQNTGNYPATFIEVYDTIIKTLDINSFEMIKASHPYSLTFPGPNILKWRFDNINLADSISNEPESHGYIKFRIRTTPNLKMSDVISNSASIYFDFNSPVITNSIKTSFITATHNVISNNLPLEVYPNPVSNITQVRFNLSEKMNCRLELMDPSGKIVLVKGAERLKGEQLDSIDMTNYTSGVYFLRIYTEKGMGEAKIVKK
ncbi:MAG TPA: T9SS type A sorting domain-containing protein [Saprospiraceae bacterium]|nr:T9SS type A sorting domain-containing protein [Saprospiraceae bacterium]